MTDNNKYQNEPQKIIHLGSFDFAGKGPGTYSGGVVKLYGKPEEDLLDSAESFLRAADRCLNSCKVEAGVEMLTVPGTVCASFSCELFLKYILLRENSEATTGHKLLDLFQKCSTGVQTSLRERKPDILEILERNNSHFVEARYHYENNGFSFRQQELLQTAEILSRFVRENYLDKDA
jgi:HEPN domain-containing protein